LTDWRQLHGDFFAGSRSLVTGGAGFIGSHLAEALMSLGGEVVVIDDLSGSKLENLDGLGPVTFVQGSILKSSLLSQCIRGCQFVFHQAALGSVPASIEQPRKYEQVNATGTMEVLEAARAAGVKRVMFAASSSAYGDAEELPKVETVAPRPLSPYAATKVAGEALCKAWANSYGLDTAPLRYFNIFGPRQSPDSAYAAVIAAFAKALLAGKHPLIFGDGIQSRDFTFVHNVVHANLLAARRAEPIGGDVTNVGCGLQTSVNELATTMAELLGRPDLTPDYRPPRAGDVLHSLADLTRAKEVLGYEPIVGFRDGLGATLDWYKTVLTPGA
jgi:nucleoside-diphosphate-sugar epimerase